MKPILPLLATAFLGLEGTAAAVDATSHHVAANGNDSNPGTLEQPFQSAAKALSRVKPGDAVVFRAGRYPPFEVHNLNGTPEAWITVRAHPRERVTIDRHLEVRKDVRSCIHIHGRCSYLAFEGFEITNSKPLIDRLRPLDVSDPGDLAKFQPYVARPEGEEGGLFSCGVRINPPYTAPHHHHLVFRNLEIHHFLGLGFSGGGDDFQFLDNHVYDLGRPRSGYGWYTSGNRHVYRGNIVHDNIYGFHLYSEGGKRPLCDSVVENNIVYNNGGTPYYHMSSRKVHRAGVGLLIVPGEKNIVRNNLVVNNGGGGLRLSSGGSAVVHNTVYGNRLYGLSSSAGGTVVKNNILYKNGPSDPAVEGPGNLLSDPRFRDPAVFDFHLRADSPAINAGEPLPEATADLEGLPRPHGAAPDMGAFEFAATPAFSFTLSAGTALSVSPSASVSTSITATRVSGTAQAIRFMALGLPPDVGLSFVPMSGTPPCTTRLTLTPTGKTPTGAYPFTVSAAGGGRTQSSRFSLTVKAAAPPKVE